MNLLNREMNMKKNIYIILSLFAFSLLYTSCESTFEEKYVDEWTDEEVWGYTTYAQAVVNNLYVGVPTRPDNYGSNFLDAATDNAMTTYDSTTRNLALGNFSAYSNPLDNWSTCYGYIQQACIFIRDGFDDDVIYSMTSDSTDEGIRMRLRGEAFFMRAYYHFELLKVYGGKGEDGIAYGVPIITEYTTTDDAEAMLSDYNRPTYEQTVEQILADLEEAYSYLTDTYAVAQATVGRANAETARALMSRVSLYAASPAYRDDAVVTCIGTDGTFTVNDETAYKEGWTEAVRDADMAIDVAGSFYGITSDNLADSSATTPSEFIFRKYFNNNTMEGYHFMPRYFGSAYTTPSQSLVDAFPMANGYPITADAVDSGYDPENPYEGRDSRFYMNIYYHGAEYGTTDYESDTNPLTTVDISPKGLDSPTSSFNASQTGYYLAKFMSKNFPLLIPTATSNSIHYHPLIRRTELYLNLAEAMNEAFGPDQQGSYIYYGEIDDSASDGDSKDDMESVQSRADETGTTIYVNTTAYEIIKSIRSTYNVNLAVGDPYLESIKDNKDAMRELIQNERRIELAFENHRFWDMRRCLLNLNESIGGVAADSDGNFEYNDNVQNRNYTSYYLPLPYDEVVKGLVNNKGW